MSDTPEKPPSRPPVISHHAAYADLFDRLLDPAFLLDPVSHVILEANHACEKVLGGDLERLVGRKLSAFVEESQREDFGKALRVAMRRYHPRTFESAWKIPAFLAEGGRVLVMEILACPLRLAGTADASGASSPRRNEEVLQVIARDITFRREAEKQMQSLLKELQGANAKLQIMSTVDEMTGLFNYRHFKAQHLIEHTRSRRYGTPYGVVFCDIDHFKHYNDRHGHPAGDALLRELAVILQKCCRVTDFAARYGGEEFVVLCPGAGVEGALVLAERIRSALAAAKLPLGDQQPLGKLSLSIGVSAYPMDGESPERVLKAADEAMYYSKTHGRDQITAATSPKKINQKAS